LRRRGCGGEEVAVQQAGEGGDADAFGRFSEEMAAIEEQLGVAEWV
jgi:hypothetical protein